jgi:zinc transporter 9
MASSEKAVKVAIAGNSFLLLAKSAGFLMSGSPAMLSEAIHSAADVTNQSLLAFGIRQSRRPATAAHPYGYHRARFVWALISAVGIFFLGCGVTVYHGVHSLLHPAAVEGSVSLILGILALSAVIEGYTLRVAFEAVNEDRRGRPFAKYFREMDDPMAAAVLLEDGAAVLGVMVAMAAVGMAHLTGSPAFDAIGSIVIGLLMGGVAVALIHRSRQLLIGSAPADEVLRRVTDIIAGQETVEGIHDVKAEVLGSGAVRFKAEVDFDGRAIARGLLKGADLGADLESLKTPEDLAAYLESHGEAVAAAIGDVVDHIEAEIRAAAPEMAHVDLESD